jgi:RNA polymerase sigma factor (TIGR02999 family)
LLTDVKILGMDRAGASITQLLDEWRQGDPRAFDRLVPLVYDHLRDVAGAYLRGEAAGHTLQATALVNEVFLRLMNNQSVQYVSRSHFFAFAAKLMRRVLVDAARVNAAQKRGSDARRVALAPELAWVDASSPEMVDLDRALDELAEIDPERVRTIELRFFLGATAEETAEFLGLSRSRVDRDMNFALSWLHHRLRDISGGQNGPDLRLPH